jgi:hypothetical protein
MDEVPRVGSLAAVALFVCAVGATAQDSLDWLTGTWSQQRRPKDAAVSPATFQIAVADGILRIVEGRLDGTSEFQCRTDGSDTRSTEVKSKATVENESKCKLSARSIEMKIRSLATGAGIPPQRTESQMTFELTRSGVLKVRTRIWANVAEFGEIELFDERAEYVKTQ